MRQWIHRYMSPKQFFETSALWIKFLKVACVPLFIYGLCFGLYFSPSDYQQGEGYRIIYIHVPAAFLSLGIYVLMAQASVIGFIWQIKLALMSIKTAAVLGAWFTLLALITGALWGKPMWGTYWVWDARLTSELILLFLYLGIIALHQSIPNLKQADKAAGVLALIGVVNLPVIHYSVYWWSTLHQANSINFLGDTTIAKVMLYPLAAMITSFLILFLILFFQNLRSEILIREKNAKWIEEIKKT